MSTDGHGFLEDVGRLIVFYFISILISPYNCRCSGVRSIWDLCFLKLCVLAFRPWRDSKVFQAELGSDA
jgi:hypothetical protein